MGIFDFIKAGAQELCIARPAEARPFLLYAHPASFQPSFARVTLDYDECAVVTRGDSVIGILGPGRHTLDTSSIPFLARVASGTGYEADISFVKTLPFQFAFGGPLCEIASPGLAPYVPLYVGSCALVISDPATYVVAHRGRDANEMFELTSENFRYEIASLALDVSKRQRTDLDDLNEQCELFARQLVQDTPYLEQLGLSVVRVEDLRIDVVPAETSKRPARAAAAHRPPQPKAQARVAEPVSAAWGRPRKIAAVLTELCMEVPQRLSAKRFGELVIAVQRQGWEAALVDGTPLTPTSPSPGIDAKIRLRKFQS
jgi:hypothetical protein